MIKDNKTISQPIIGMNKDLQYGQFKPEQYRSLINGNSQSEVGNNFIIQNEPSNYYGVKFPDTYKVIGIERTEERTYFFLTSTTENTTSVDYKRSSIGYVDNVVLDTYNQDSQSTTGIDCGECGQEINDLDTPLELTTQTPYHEYVELVHDRCIEVEDIECQGLNFNINFPIKKIDIKFEKLGTTLYWEDWRNPSRYIQISRIEEAKEQGTFDYLHTVDIACEEPEESDCILVDKLLVFPKHKRIIIEAKEEQIGGNLKKGTYEFWAAYCDLYGNPITEYSTPTNPISIWDEYNNILEQTETDEFTNAAIKLKIHNLDIERFKYYKIAVVERNNVSNTQSVFLAGVYPTTDDVVIYTHSGSNNDDLYIARGNVSLKKRMTMEELLAIKPIIKRAKGSMISDERRFIFGLEVEEEINMQPVVNIFSQLVKAQTSVASENLYKSSIATSKYKQYTRNDVQPLGIRFLYNSGGYSAIFPFVGRPATEFDLEVIPDTNTNRKSLMEGLSYCVEDDRTQRWQIFNTAEKVTSCFNINDPSNSIRLDDEVTAKIKTCSIPTPINTGTVTISLEEKFTDLEGYVKEHSTDLCTNVPTNPYYNAQLCSLVDYTQYSNVVCTPEVVCGDEGSISVIGNPTILIKEVENEQSTFVYKTAAEYDKVRTPEYCSPFNGSEATGYNRDTAFEDNYMPFTDCLSSGCIKVAECTLLGDARFNYAVYKRNISSSNQVFSGATLVPYLIDVNQNSTSIVMDYQGSDDFNDLRNTHVNLTIPAQTISGFIFSSNVHNNAKFHKIEKNGRDKIIFEISRYNGVITNDFFSLVNNPYVRYTIFNKYSNPTIYSSGIVNLNDGFLTELDVTSFPSTFYIAIDSPIITTSTLTSDCVTTKTSHILTPPPSCFSIYQRDIEAKEVTITWDKIYLEKQINYEETCPSYLPNVYDCEPIPFEKFKMAYWQSNVEYPDNRELWDSSNIKIKPSHLTDLEVIDRTDFLEYFTENGDLDTEGNYIYKNIEGSQKKVTELYCEPIRHPKFPDNNISPYIIDNINHKKEADSIIFPMGVNIDDKVVQAMIDVAFDNGIIDEKQKSRITGWEILRGDNSIHKSVTSSGILYDINDYTATNGDTINFSNFPYNDLGVNKFILNPQGNLINHKYNAEKNNQFTYLSPDLFLTKPSIPTELSLQGYLFGSANISFYDVKKHPKWVVLGGETYRTADTLAAAEVALEIIIAVANATKETSFTNVGGVIAATAIGIGYAIQSYMRYGQYRYQWLQIFRNLGDLYNFASFQAGEGRHNRMLTIPQYDDNYLRRLSIKKYIKDDMYNFTDENNGNIIRLNHDRREHSVFLKTGNEFLEYPEFYKTFDNNIVKPNLASNFVASDVNCVENSSHTRDIANPYVQLKNYIPDQWDTIDSIKWLTTNYIFDLGEDTTCKVIYGGTQVISRFSWRVKVPLFRDNAIELADKLPYLYSRNSNIAQTRFYCNYETASNATFSGLGSIFPDIRSEIAFDCITGLDDFYVKPPSKFYLFTHGIIDFLVESEINCNFRYSKTQPKDQFYQGQSLERWLQEVDLPIVEPNTFYYNNTYTFPVSNTPSKKLDRTYSKEIWDKRRFYHNAWIWSERDNNENSLIDPYLVYKPLNFHEDKSNRGMLIDLRSIESEQFLGRYENQLQLFNQVNQYSDSINTQNKELGTGFLYSRPMNFKATDLGFMGTQNTDFVSTPYGHFWVDNKRGRVFQVDQNGTNAEVISENIGGKPSNMRNWFREHLPYKILKYLPNIDIDNRYKGIGMNIWYDDRFARIFFTKRDYILKPGIDKNKFKYNEETQQILYENEEVFFNNRTLFKDVSWTITYSPTQGGWSSYFTFYPDYSIAHQNYFQIGFNWDEYVTDTNAGTMWNHLMNNRSFNVFQGRYQPWELEYPVVNQGADKILSSLSINIEARRYQNAWDYVYHSDIGVTNMFIYNHRQNSGMLKLIPQKTITDLKNYPKTIGNTQEILTTFNENKQITNYFYNRVLNDRANIPHLSKDDNNIFSTIDNRNVKFGGKRITERLTGSEFIVNLSNKQDSRFNILIKNIVNSDLIQS